MEELQIFNHELFGTVRGMTIDGNPWFVGKDVAAALGYSNPSKALIDHVDEEDKLNNESLLSLGQRGGWIINESGLYSLILTSKLPAAKEFKHWVTSEVLPSIRKHGGYIVGQETISDDELLLRAVMVAQRKIQEREEKIKELKGDNERMKPKEVFADAVSASDDTILIRELAKMLKQNGVDMGEKRLFSWMRDNGYLISKKGVDYNSPAQKSMEMGLFQIRETSVVHSDGTVSIGKTPRVTGKGQVYFLNKMITI